MEKGHAYLKSIETTRLSSERSKDKAEVGDSRNNKGDPRYSERINSERQTIRSSLSSKGTT
jgi:hypothetical protein